MSNVDNARTCNMVMVRPPGQSTMRDVQESHRADFKKLMKMDEADLESLCITLSLQSSGNKSTLHERLQKYYRSKMI